MTELSVIRDRIASKLTDGELVRPTSAQITQAINATIDYYENRYFWFQQGFSALTTVDGDPVLSGIPADFKFQQHPNSLVLLKNNYRYPLEHITPIEFDQVTNDISESFPRFYTYRTGAFELYPTPDDAYTVNLYYWKSFADLVADTDENDFTIYAERLIEYKSMLDLLEDYLPEDDRIMIYRTKVKDELDTIENETYNRLSTGRLTTENIAEYDNTAGDYYYYYRNY